MVPREEKASNTQPNNIHTSNARSINIFQGCLHPPACRTEQRRKIFDGGWKEWRKIQTEIEFLSMYSTHEKANFSVVGTEFRRNEDSCKTPLTVLVLLLAPADDGTAGSGGELLHVSGRQANGQQMIVKRDTSRQLREESDGEIEKIKFSKRECMLVPGRAQCHCRGPPRRCSGGGG